MNNVEAVEVLIQQIELNHLTELSLIASYLKNIKTLVEQDTDTIGKQNKLMEKMQNMEIASSVEVVKLKKENAALTSALRSIVFDAQVELAKVSKESHHPYDALDNRMSGVKYPDKDGLYH